MYQGDTEAVAFLGSSLYWKYVRQRKVWIGKGQEQEAYEYTTSRYGWATSELCTNPLILLKNDDYCGEPENPDCRCYASPEQWWSLPEMTEAQQREWLRYEDSTPEELNNPSWWKWWDEAGRKNNLIKEA